MLNDYAATRNDGMPLGGIGAGSLEIRPNGYFGNCNEIRGKDESTSKAGKL
jgi:uncharacterized protein (DUF608 family)